MTTQSTGRLSPRPKEVLSIAGNMRRVRHVNEIKDLYLSTDEVYDLPCEDRIEPAISAADVAAAREFIETDEGQTQLMLLRRHAVSGLVRKAILRVAPQMSFDDVDETEQDVWAKVVSSLSTFDDSKSSFDTWVHNIATGETARRLRDQFRQKRPRTVSGAMFEECADDGTSEPYYDALARPDREDTYTESAEECAARSGHADRVLAWIATLPDQQRRVAELVFVEELPATKAADQLGLAASTVRNTVQQIRTKAKLYMD